MHSALALPLALSLLLVAAAFSRPDRLRGQTSPSARLTEFAATPADTASSTRSRQDAAAERAARILARNGFTDVAALIDGDRLVVTFENDRYRDERRALREATRHLASEILGRELILIPARRSIPLVVAHYAVSTSEEPDVSLDLSNLPASLWSAPRANSSHGKLDVIVHPWLEAQLGSPSATRAGLAPELRVSLGKGLNVSAQILVALRNTLHPEQPHIRPAAVTLNQMVRLPRNVFLSATAGTFTRDRYGVDVAGRAFFRDGRWSIGTQLGLTGATAYRRDGWSFSRVEAPMALVDVAWRNDRYDLTVRTTAGSFLDRDKGGRLDVVRRFGELEIGGFATYGERGSDTGMTLRLPLPPPRHARRGPVRLRVADAFRLEYRYRGPERGVRRYELGPGLEEFGRMVNPDLLRADDGEAPR